jgi:hypothetical protein
MEDISLLATETLLYGVLALQAAALLLLIILVAYVSPLSGQLIRLPENVLKTLKGSLDLEPVHSRLEEIEVASTRAAGNVTRLDDQLRTRADLENKVGVLQTLFGTVVGLAGAVGVDWAIHGGSILSLDSWVLRLAIVLVPCIFVAVVVPRKVYNVLYRRDGDQAI